MAGLSPAHLLIILVIALIVIGPGKLPEVGAAIGKSIREFQKASGGMSGDILGSLTGTSKPATPAPQAPPPAQPYYPAPPYYPAQPPAQPYYPAEPAPAPYQPVVGAEPTPAAPAPVAIQQPVYPQPAPVAEQPPQPRG